MRTNNRWLLALALLVVAAPLLAQNPTGTLLGTVTDEQGAGLPGVTVTATSPAMQGERTAQTGNNGGYKLPFLPPGEYRVTYELEGFATKVRKVIISAAQSDRSDIQMQIAEVTETIVVTDSVETISETRTVANTVTQSELEALPVTRTPLQAVNLAPGVADTGPSSEPSIHGAMTFENLYLVNGVVVNENIRGQFLPLFIEDAIQETTTATAGISAEYGRFTGGVVNVITKSGGNQFSGSLRVNVTNEDWISDANRFKLNPDAEPNVDKTNEIYEGTLGGPIWKDRIWFFGAGRDKEETSTGTTTLTQIVYPRSDTEQRIEGKLTISPHPSHSLIGSYLEISRTRANSGFVREMDLQSLTNRTDPQDITAANYTGILTPSFFVEAQYSERFFEIATGAGGPPDLIAGTMIRHRPTARRYHSPTFCGSCEPEIRNNDNMLLKGSYFLTTEGSGSHDLVFGYDTFSDIRFSVNHQTGSDFQVWGNDIFVDENNNIFSIWTTTATVIGWWPPVGLDIARDTDFETNSLYANDSWQLNDKWSFNIGVRYDENDGRDSSGQLVTDDSKISPRLGMSYDVRGDGDLVVNASYGSYVAAIANSGNVADGASTGGALAGFFSRYLGPPVNANCPPDCVDNETALGILFDWYFAAGGTRDVNEALADPGRIPGLFFTSIPGATTRVPEGFKSPGADEITLGVTKRLGNKGLVRVDLVYRDWTDFYSDRTVQGETYDVNEDGRPDGDVRQLGNFGNAFLERTYEGLETQFRYRFTDRFTLAGNYTLSANEGNVTGEFSNSGPVSTDPLAYPEFSDQSWENPKGKLGTDQKHKARVWGVYDLIDNDRHNLNVALLQNFFSGTPYSLTGAVDTTPGSATGDHVRSNFNVSGYVEPPSTVGYFFSKRGAFRTDDITRTDISLNYAFNWNAFGRSMQVFLQPEVINVFDEDALVSPTTTILDATDSATCPNGPGGRCADFNAFTETPIEGVHWRKASDFGEADNENDFQQPRTFRFSVGFRF